MVNSWFALLFWLYLGLHQVNNIGVCECECFQETPSSSNLLGCIEWHIFIVLIFPCKTGCNSCSWQPDHTINRPIGMRSIIVSKILHMYIKIADNKGF